MRRLSVTVSERSNIHRGWTHKIDFLFRFRLAQPTVQAHVSTSPCKTSTPPVDNEAICWLVSFSLMSSLYSIPNTPLWGLITNPTSASMKPKAISLAHVIGEDIVCIVIEQAAVRSQTQSQLRRLWSKVTSAVRRGVTRVWDVLALFLQDRDNSSVSLGFRKAVWICIENSLFLLLRLGEK